MSPMRDLDLFRYELCVDYQNEYHMDKEEAQRFSEAFSLFLKEMTKVNGAIFMNSHWLRENFFDLWNANDPPKMLRACIEYAVSLSALRAQSNKTKKDENAL